MLAARRARAHAALVGPFAIFEMFSYFQWKRRRLRFVFITVSWQILLTLHVSFVRLLP